MKIGDIMNRAPVTVRIDQTFAEAYAVMLDRRFTSLPVVDAKGAYLGNFDLRDVWNVLLPKATQLSRKAIEDLSFVSGSVERYKDRLAEVSGESVAKFVNKTDQPAVHPDTPVTQAMLQLDAVNEAIAVVDRTTHHVVGVVSAWEILHALR